MLYPLSYEGEGSKSEHKRTQDQDHLVPAEPSQAARSGYRTQPGGPPGTRKGPNWEG